MELEVHLHAECMLGHLTEEQRRDFGWLDAAFVELMSGSAPSQTDVEALAEAVVSVCDVLPQPASLLGFELCIERFATGLHAETTNLCLPPSSEFSDRCHVSSNRY